VRGARTSLSRDRCFELGLGSVLSRYHSGMKLIPSSHAVNFLAQVAPKPWVQRTLRWMALDEGLLAFGTRGTVQPFTTVGRFTIPLYKEAGEFSGAKMDAVIREHFSPEMAARLVGKSHDDRVDDEAYVWEHNKEPRTLDPGFFLFATEIDWDDGVIKAHDIPSRGALNETFFPDSDFIASEFEEADFEVEIEGLSFEFETIQLLLPNVELRQSAAFVTSPLESQRPRGRPAKWDWEGALAFVITQAQHPDGLPTGPGAQARVEEMITGWFMDQTGGAPASSQVRERAAKIMRMLEMPKLPVPN
jgi:hypothetical protein